MTKHSSVTLELKKDKPNNVYRFINRWQLHPSHHGDGGNVFYLFVDALVQWGPGRDYPANVFSIVMQYSPEIGHNVDISQPAHIHEKDIKEVNEAFQTFVGENVK